MAVVASSNSTVLRLFRDLPLLHALRISGLGGAVKTGSAQLGSMLGSPAELREFFVQRGGQIQASLTGVSASPVHARPAFTGQVVDLAAIPLSPLGAYQVRSALGWRNNSECGCLHINSLTLQVRLCVTGLWRVITIDDRIPTNAVSGAAAFTTARRRQAWAVLLEKVCIAHRSTFILMPVFGGSNALNVSAAITPYLYL